MNTRSGSPLAILFALGVIICAALGTFYFKSRADAMDEQAVVPAETETVIVEVYTVKPQDRAVVIRRRGLLKGVHEVIVSAEVEGTVIDRPIQEGQQVAAGNTLCQIDPTFHEFSVQEAQALLDEAEAVYSNAQAEVDRVKDLEEDQRRPIELSRFLSARDQAKAGRNRAATNLAQAKEGLTRCRISSPIAGIVSAVFYERGGLLAPGSPVAEIVQLDHMRLLVDLTELEVAQLGEDPQIEVSSLGFSDLTFSGRVNAIYPKADPTTRRIPVELTVDNPQQLLRSGTMVDCTIQSRIAQDKILIPAKAVLNEFGAQFCYVADSADDGVVVRRQRVTTKPIASSVRWLQAAEGIKYGDQLILSHHQEIKPGAIIQTRNVEVDIDASAEMTDPAD